MAYQILPWMMSIGSLFGFSLFCVAVATVALNIIKNALKKFEEDAPL